MAVSPDQAAKNLQAMKNRLPRLIGAEIVGFALDNWDRQGFQGSSFKPWPQRNDKRPGAILVGKQSGRLRRSIRQIRATQKEVTAGSDVEYAATHNEGETLTVQVTPKSRKFFWFMYMKTKEERWRAMALTKKQFFKITIPQRRFIGPSPELDKRIAKVVERELKRALS